LYAKYFLQNILSQKKRKRKKKAPLNPKSQSFSRSYGSNLPTSLTYIVPITRGCSPRRPAAVMSTDGQENESLPPIFKGRRERTGRLRKRGALPTVPPLLRSTRFRGRRAFRNEPKPRAAKKPKTTLPPHTRTHALAYAHYTRRGREEMRTARFFRRGQVPEVLPCSFGATDKSLLFFCTAHGFHRVLNTKKK